MLQDEIIKAQRLVRTDAYQMSIGEIVSMYNEGELIIDPEFQRLFRWDVSQKSKLIESLLLGIPIPSIFVFETESGLWELIDGLQRTSTILEFMGQLRDSTGSCLPPSILNATKYLPSLYNAVWENSEGITDVPIDEQAPLEKMEQLAIRRARIGVEILKRPSDNQTKYDLFQRLNAGGTQANAQELRNCILLMVNASFFGTIKQAAESEAFKNVVQLTEDQLEKQRHMELAMRFLVHSNVEYDGRLDIEEYIDEGIVSLAERPDTHKMVEQMVETFRLLNTACGSDTFRRYTDGRHMGRFGLIGFEVVAIGVSRNLQQIQALSNPANFVKVKIQGFWSAEELASFTSPGLRGTTRIQRTVPFGTSWFRP